MIESMADDFVVEALGVRVQILASNPSRLRDLAIAWEACLATKDSPVEAVVPGDRGWPLLEEGPLLEWATQQVTYRAMESRAGQLLMLHACAVAQPGTGRSVILVGPSGMGKTTLASSLGRRWAYVTDETAGVTEDLDLLAYPKPLSMVVGPGEAKIQVSPSQLGLTPWRRSSRPVGILLLDRRPNLSAAKVERVDTAPAIALLAEHASFLGRLDRPLARLAELLKAVDGLTRVSYTEAEHVVPVVAEIFGET